MDQGGAAAFRTLAHRPAGRRDPRLAGNGALRFRLDPILVGGKKPDVDHMALDDLADGGQQGGHIALIIRVSARVQA